MAYHSAGAFSHDEVYEMPSVNRRYFIQLLAQELEKQQKASKNTQHNFPKPPTPGLGRRKP